MKLDNYKNIKKTEWQELATLFGIEWDDSSVVRYLVEKIAEKLEINDKIVSDNELKKLVVTKINSEYEIVPENSSNDEDEIEETKDEELVKEVENIEPPKQLTRLEELRLECENYGVAWAENHSESNLEQVLNGVKNAGIQPVSGSTISSDIKPSIDTSTPFEITSSNADVIAQTVANIPNTAINPLSIPSAPPVNGGYSTSNTYLQTYAKIYLNTIRGHFRLLTISEINEMINRDKQTFTHQINFHPQQNNKIELILTQNSDSVRVPENTSEWIDING